MPDETTPTPEQKAADAAAEVKFGSLVEAFKSKFGDVPDDMDDDTLTEAIQQSFQRATLLSDKEDENTLKAYRDAFARTQSSDWNEFQKWQQTQQKNADTQQDTDGRKYKPVKVDPQVMALLERDKESGMFRSKFPEMASRADEANRMWAYRQQLAEEMYGDPYAFGEEIARPALARIEKDLMAKISALEEQLKPIKSTAEEMTKNRFVNQHASELFTADDKGRQALTPVGKAYSLLAEKGIPEEEALQLAKQLAPAAAPPEDTKKKTEDVKQSFKERAKKASNKTDQTTDVSNTIRESVEQKTLQTQTRLSPRARWKAAAAEAEREALEGQAS